MQAAAAAGEAECVEGTLKASGFLLIEVNKFPRMNF